MTGPARNNAAPKAGPLEVTITAVTLSGNKGAEGMFWAIRDNLAKQFPEMRFNLATYYPKADQSRAPEGVTVCSSTPLALVTGVFFSSLAYALCKKIGITLPNGVLAGNTRAVAKSAMLLDAAGVSFSDGREKFLPFNILTMLPAVFMGVPAVKCSQAMGPFKGRVNRLAAGWFLPRLHKVFARGLKTKEHLDGLGNVPSAHASDLVFCLEPEPLPAGLSLPTAPEGGSLIGISPSSLVESKSTKRGLDYCGTLAGFIHRATRGGKNHVILVPHSIRLDTDKSRNNDLPTCRRIMDLLQHPEHCTLLDRELKPAQLKTVVHGCDYFIASRFHSMVAALSGAVPLIVCGWGHKYLEVLDDFGLAHMAFDFSEMCFDTLWRRFGELVQNGEEVKSQIVENLPRVREQSARQFTFIIQELARKAGIAEPAPGGDGGHTMDSEPS